MIRPRLQRLIVLVVCLVACSCAVGQSREEKVRNDKRRVEAEGFWIYNDLDKAYAEAKQTGKPILVSMRCLPCEECVKLDDDLIDNDPVVRPLLDQFVCVRVVGTNGLDLNTFQYDTDQSFAMFMLAADKTILGRFGTRSHRTEWHGDVSIEGMAEALKAGLALHANYPGNRRFVAGKRGEPLEFDTPEAYPTLKGKYTDRLNYEGDVVKSCIHCHQIGDARRDFYWSQSKPIPEKLLFPYPHPKSIGLILDPERRGMVKSVVVGSPAERSGFEAGDDLLVLDGQAIVSMADVQWVLHHAESEGDRLPVTLRREGKSMNLDLVLPTGWRRLDDPSWRVAAWGIGRMMTGGMRLEELDEAARQQAGVESGMALRAKHVGQYGDHAAAKRVGLQKGDIIITFDGRSDFQREAELFAYVNENRKPGDKVVVEYLRGKQRRSATIPIQR